MATLHLKKKHTGRVFSGMPGYVKMVSPYQAVAACGSHFRKQYRTTVIFVRRIRKAIANV